MQKIDSDVKKIQFIKVPFSYIVKNKHNVQGKYEKILYRINTSWKIGFTFYDQEFYLDSENFKY